MQILQPAHGLLGTKLQRLTDCRTRRQGGGATDLVLQSVTTNGVRVSNRLTAFSGVDDQGDFVILDHVDHVRTPFGDLVHATHWQASGLDHLRRAGSRHHFEAKINQLTRQISHQWLVVIAHADKGTTAIRQNLAGTQLSLGKRLAEAVANAHHFTSRLHFWAEDRVHALELGEREHRFLNAEERRDDFFGEADFRQGLARHYACSNLGQRLTDALGDEWHGTRSARVDFNDVDVLALHGHLHVHQTNHTELQGHFLDLVADLVLDVLRQRVRRQRARRVTGVHTRLFNVLHDRADNHLLAIAHRVHVHFDGAVEEVIQQYRAVVGDLHSLTHVATQLFFLVDDFHRPTTQHVGWTHHQRVADGLGGRQGFVFTASSDVGRLTQVEALHHLLEALAVFGAVDGVRRGTDDWYAGLFQGTGQFQRGLAAVLDDDALRLLDTDDFQYVFQGYWLEVQAIGGVVVGRYGFRVAVDHDGLVTVFTHRQCRVHAAVVELDALTDTVRSATEDHDLVAGRRIGLALFLVGRVQVSGVSGELGGAGVNALVDRQHFQLVALVTQVLLGHTQQLGQARVGEALALELAHQVVIDRRQTQGLDVLFVFDQVFDLHQEPVVDLGQGVDVVAAHAGTECISHIPDAPGARHGQLALDDAGGFRVARLDLRVEAVNAHFQTAQGFLQGLLEGTADSHHFTHRFPLNNHTPIRLF